MVEYSEWTSIVFEVAPDDVDATEVISWAAAEWNETPGLKTASKREARDHARRSV